MWMERWSWDSLFEEIDFVKVPQEIRADAAIPVALPLS
jgi:hypothetical protein